MFLNVRTIKGPLSVRSKGSRSLQAIEPNTLRAFGRTNVRTYEPSAQRAPPAVNAADRPRMGFSCASCQSERFQKSAGTRLRSIRHCQGQLEAGEGGPRGGASLGGQIRETLASPERGCCGPGVALSDAFQSRLRAGAAGLFRDGDRRGVAAGGGRGGGYSLVFARGRSQLALVKPPDGSPGLQIAVARMAGWRGNCARRSRTISSG
jgi:hypothetical protein